MKEGKADNTTAHLPTQGASYAKKLSTCPLWLMSDPTGLSERGVTKDIHRLVVVPTVVSLNKEVKK